MTPDPSEATSRARALLEDVAYVVQKCRESEASGYRSKERQFVLDILERHVKTSAVADEIDGLLQRIETLETALRCVEEYLTCSPYARDSSEELRIVRAALAGRGGAP